MDNTLLPASWLDASPTINVLRTWALTAGGAPTEAPVAGGRVVVALRVSLGAELTAATGAAPGSGGGLRTHSASGRALLIVPVGETEGAARLAARFPAAATATTRLSLVYPVGVPLELVGPPPGKLPSLLGPLTTGLAVVDGAGAPRQGIEGTTLSLPLGTLFSGTSIATTYEAASGDENTATVLIEGGSVRVTLLAAGDVTITVAATQGGQTAEVAVPVTVLSVDDVAYPGLADYDALEGVVGAAVGDVAVVDHPLTGGIFDLVDTAAGGATPRAPDGGTVFAVAERTSAHGPVAPERRHDLLGVADRRSVALALSDPTEPDTEAQATLGFLEAHGHGKGQFAFDGPSTLLVPTLPYDAQTLSWRTCDDGVRWVRRAVTTDYRPEWWGGAPYPDHWTPTTATPAPGEDPLVAERAAGRDATDALCWALNAAGDAFEAEWEANLSAAGGDAEAAADPPERVIVLSGMYGFQGQVDGRSGVRYRGAVPGVRSKPGDAVRQGLRQLRGSLYALFGKAGFTRAKNVDPAYLLERSARDWALSFPKTFVCHGPTSGHTHVRHASGAFDVEIDGNAGPGLENAYCFTDKAGHRAATGPSTYDGGTYFDQLLQDSSHGKGADTADGLFAGVPGSRMQWNNVHVHDTPNDGFNGNSAVSMGGSSDLLIGNCVRNHGLYGVQTHPGSWVENVTLYGFFHRGAQTGWHAHIKNLRYENLTVHPPEFGLERIVPGAVARRGQGLAGNNFFDPETSYHYFGESLLLDGLHFDITDTPDDQGVGTNGVYHYPRLIRFEEGILDVRGLDVWLGTTAQGAPRRRWLSSSKTPNHAAGRNRHYIEAAVHTGEILGTHIGSAALSYWKVKQVNRGGSTSTTTAWAHSSPGTEAHEHHALFLEGDFEMQYLWDITAQAGAALDVYLIGAAPGETETTPLRLFPVNGQSSMTRMLKTTGMTAANASNFRFSVRDAVGRGAGFYATEAEGAWLLPQYRLLRYTDTLTGRASEATGALAAAALTPAGGGGYVDVPTGLVFWHDDVSEIQVIGADAGRFVSATRQGTYGAAVVRLAFTGTSPVTVTWTAQAAAPEPGYEWPVWYDRPPEPAAVGAPPVTVVQPSSDPVQMDVARFFQASEPDGTVVDGSADPERLVAIEGLRFIAPIDRTTPGLRLLGRTLTIDPAELPVGEGSVEVRVEDPHGRFALQTFSYEVGA